MAISDKIPKISAEVLVKNVALQQYEDEDENQGLPAAVTKYIEAKSGAEFAIRYKFEEKPQHNIRVDCHLDGKWAANQLAVLDDFRNGTLLQTMEGVKSNTGGTWVLAKFSFSDLKTVESARPLSQGELVKELKDLGQITMKFSYITNLKFSTMQVLNPYASSKGVGELHEKALKGRGVSHESTLRDPVPTTQVRVMTSEYLDPSQKPFLTLNFKYRSRDALKALMIVPRSPSPVPLDDRDIDSLSPDDMRELIRRQRERDAAARVVKREHGIKREHSRERSGTSGTFDVNEGNVSVVSAKRRRLPVTIDEDGTETIDLT